MPQIFRYNVTNYQQIYLWIISIYENKLEVEHFTFLDLYKMNGGKQGCFYVFYGKL